MPISLPRSASAIGNRPRTSTAPGLASPAPWLWWHLLSLDAPTVAVVWCWFFGACFGLHFSWATLSTLALGTWTVYVADRLLDGWRSIDTFTLRDRHWFYLRHRKPFLIAWGFAAVPLAYMILLRVQPAVRIDDIVLCLAGIAYFLFIHGRLSVSSRSRFFPKELAVGFLFAIATAVPAWARLHTDRNLLLAAVLTFGAACWLNCVAIQTWEDAEAAQEIVHTILSATPLDPAPPRPHGLTELLGQHLAAFAIAVCTLSLALATAVGGDVRPLFVSVAISALLFFALIRYSHHFSALSLRIAADAALLTPLLFLLRVR